MLCHVKVIFISYFLFNSLFSTRILAAKNGVIAGHGAGYMERHCMDG
jgi:hypothetical protein